MKDLMDAVDENTTAERLLEIVINATSDEWEVVREVVQNPNCPAEALLLAAENEDVLLHHIAKHANAPFELQEYLATYPNMWVRYNLLKQENPFQEIIEILMQDSDGQIAGQAGEIMRTHVWE